MQINTYNILVFLTIASVCLSLAPFDTLSSPKIEDDLLFLAPAETTNRLLQQTPYSNIEFCAAVGQQYRNTTNIIYNLTIGSTLTITQSVCEIYFRVPMNNSAYQNSYIMVEMYIQGQMPSNLHPLLAEQKGYTPYLYYAPNSSFAYDIGAFDGNGFYNRKNYNYIMLTPSNVTIGMDFFFAVYEFYQPEQKFTPQSFTYTLNATASSQSPPCPRGCMNNGKCTTTGQCICWDNYIDEDCSVAATNILMGNPTSQTCAAGQWTYFYYVVNNFNSDLQLTVTKNAGLLELAIVFQTGDVAYIPNDQYAESKYYFPLDSGQLVLGIPMSTQNGRVGKKTILGIYNSFSSDVAVTAQLSVSQSDDNTKATVMYVLIGVAVFLIVIWGVITIIKYRSYRTHQHLANNSAAARQAVRQTLTTEEVDHYFPKKKFGEFKTTLDQTCCSICLDDFNPDVICRQILCEHIFHDNCIESWLTHHENCPNCKREITKLEIEKFLKDAKEGRPILPRPAPITTASMVRNGGVELSMAPAAANPQGQQAQQIAPTNIPVQRNPDRNRASLTIPQEREEEKEREIEINETTPMRNARPPPRIRTRDTLEVDVRTSPNRNIQQQSLPGQIHN
jgi:hypothetical protein